jgi:hypothetical protein
MTTNIFSATLVTADLGWQGYNIRQLLPPSVLTGASGTGNITVTLLTDTGTAGTIDSLYIGYAAASGNPYDFDGNQVQLLFSGVSSIAVSGANTYTSDATPFTLDNTKSLIVATHFNTIGTVNSKNVAVVGATTYFRSSPDTSGETIPVPTVFTVENNLDTFFTSIDIALIVPSDVAGFVTNEW